jgi:hypothetical protein
MLIVLTFGMRASMAHYTDIIADVSMFGPIYQDIGLR